MTLEQWIAAGALAIAACSLGLNILIARATMSSAKSNRAMAKSAVEGDRRQKPVVLVRRVENLAGYDDIHRAQIVVENFATVGLTITQFRMRTRFRTLRVANGNIFPAGDALEHVFRKGWVDLQQSVRAGDGRSNCNAIQPNLLFRKGSGRKRRIWLDLKIEWRDDLDRQDDRTINFVF